MYEIAFVVLFSAAGAGAALLAVRVAPDSPPVRWLARLFLAALIANLALYLWPVIADDPAGATRLGGIASLLALAGWGYVRMLRAARRAADRRDGR